MVKTVGLVFPVGVFAPRTGNPGFTVYISTLNFKTLIFSVWYHFTQVSYFIGSTCGAIGMFVVYSNHEGRYLVIPPTTRSMVILMLTVAGMQIYLLLLY